MDRENFYLLLELSSDPPVTDEGQIRAALEQKKQEWTRWKDIAQKRNLGLAYLDLVPEIERVMLDNSLREAEAKQAGSLRASMLRRFEAELRILEGKGHLLPREVSAIVVKYKGCGVDRDTVKNTARVPISDTPPEVPPGDGGDILDRETAKTIQRNLSLLGFADLYAFLDEAPYSSIKKLRDAAEEKKKALGRKRAGDAAITKELCDHCIEIFTDFDSKQRYDRYLKVAKYPLLADMIDEEYARSGFLSTAVLVRMVNFGVESYGTGVLESEEYIRDYCAAYGISIDTQGQSLTCPACGNKTDREGAMCSVCAQPLRGQCPQCGAAFSEGQGVCTDCGFTIAEMGKALRYISDAETALIDSNWSKAQRSLQYASKYWPGHPKIPTLERRARAVEDRYAEYVENIADCVRHNQYYAALDLVLEAESRRIQLPRSTVDHVKDTVAELEREIRRLQSPDAAPTFREVMELTAQVEDSMELNRMMRQYPPLPPEQFTASVQGAQVRLGWSLSISAGQVEYVLVRKAMDKPLTAFDGDILYEGPATSFVDRTAEPLTAYHYSVYARRGGAFSETSTTAGPILLVPEIQNFRALPTDGGALLSWDFNPEIREVLIWRKLGGGRPTSEGDGILLETSRLDGFADQKIKNDVEYWYYIVAVYMVEGRRIQSIGVSESVIPHKQLAPIDHLVIAKADSGEDDYVVNWHNDQYSDVLLLASPREPVHQKGDMVAVEKLLEMYRRLDLNAKQKDSARFTYRFNGGMHIFAAAVSGKFATVGEIKYLTNVRDVESISYDIIGSELCVNMKWPTGLEEVALAYRFDDFPQSPDEGGNILVSCSRQMYDMDGGLIIREPEQSLYYCTIFSVFTSADGTRTYSTGAQLLVNNTVQQEIFYRFARGKLRGSKDITVTVSSGEGFTLPKAVIVGKVGRLPLSKTDGVPLFEIDRETKVDGSVVYRYRTTSLPDNLYIRLFLQDESLYEKFRLLPLGGVRIT